MESDAIFAFFGFEIDQVEGLVKNGVRTGVALCVGRKCGFCWVCTDMLKIKDLSGWGSRNHYGSYFDILSAVLV